MSAPDMTRSTPDEIVLREVGSPERDSHRRENAPLPSGTVPRRHLGVLAALVFLPMAAVVGYFGFIASDIYVSETRFIVRSAAHSDLTGLAALLQNQGMSRAADETYAVTEYFRSRDAARVLVDNHELKAVLSRPEADLLTRFPNFYSKNTQEALYRHFRAMITSYVDPNTGLGLLAVEAFRPDDAQRIASVLLASAEALINRLNDRANRDALEYAQKMLDEAARKVSEIEQRITEYRRRERLIDAGQEATAAMEAIGRLSVELAQNRASLDQQVRLAPSAPSAAALREGISALQKQINELRSKIVGSEGALATKMPEFELLLLQRELAAKGLGLAMLNLEKAKQTAQLQHLYLQTVSEPNLPDERSYPKRVFLIAIAIVISLFLYWTMVSIYRIIMEHQA